DNVQELGQAPLLHAGIAAALAELPEHARLIAISRDPPGAEYARALANQQLALIEASSLRFNEDETRELVHLHDRNWPAAALRQATDGWAAAMILWLAARNDLAADDTMLGGTARDRLFAFFAGEVMAKMTSSDATSLTHIAFLPSATAAMAVAISGNTRAGELLADLARRSLFTDRRDSTSPGHAPVYTFHALFGEFLRARAADVLGAGELRTLRFNAAEMLAAHGRADIAIARLIEASAWDEALNLIVAQAERFVAQGRSAMVRDWILALPEDSRTNPYAWYWLGYCELAINPADALRHIERAHREFLATGDVLGTFYSAAAAADAVIFLGASLEALGPWMPVLKEHASAYLAQRTSDTDLRVLPGLLAAFVHRETAHPLTLALADLAERMLDQPLGASQRILLGTLAYYLLWTGQVLRLEHIIIKIDRLCTDLDAAPATLLRWYTVGVLIRSLLGRVDEALLHAGRALTLTAQSPAPMRVKAHLSMVLAAIAARDAELARRHLAETSGLIDPNNAIDATTYEFQRGMLMLLDGDWGSAATLMRSAVASGRASGWPLREHIALLGHALAATQVGALDDAEAALEAALRHHFYTVCRWHHWLAALIEASLADRQGDRARCLSALARAFAVGRESGFDFGPLLYCCGEVMSRLASLALAHDIDSAFALRIIRRHALPAPPGAGERWPWLIRIRTLGGFSIERDGAPAAAARKESRKPLDLLKLVIALGGEAVPTARLCAALWPEAQGDAARNSFDNTLHRLRKLLGGDRHVPLRAGGLGLDAATCWTDLAAIETCFAAVGELAPGADAEQVEALAERTLALWRGEFLAGEDDLPDVLAARTRIQAKFTRQMSALGVRLEAIGQHAAAVLIYQRVVEQQPLAEDIYRRLITCLLALEQRGEAYEVYRRCRQQLSLLLGIPPAPETEALVASLRNL
ncbi:MAG: BTAD domain-containing putative transcriptional regulator, partial [Propionivibrio sp.]